MKTRTIDRRHQSKLSLVIFAVVELALAYGLASLAIDRGNLWWYLFALIALIGTLQNIVKLIGSFIHGNNSSKT